MASKTFIFSGNWWEPSKYFPPALEGGAAAAPHRCQLSPNTKLFVIYVSHLNGVNLPTVIIPGFDLYLRKWLFLWHKVLLLWSDFNELCGWSLILIHTAPYESWERWEPSCTEMLEFLWTKLCPSWGLSWPHSLGHECAFEPCSSVQARGITDKVVRKEMSVYAGAPKLCPLALCPARVWGHGHIGPGVAAQQLACPGVAAQLPACAGVLWWPSQSAVGTSLHSAVTLEQWQFEDVQSQNPSCAVEGRCRSAVTALYSVVSVTGADPTGQTWGRLLEVLAVPFESRDVHPKSHGNHS